MLEDFRISDSDCDWELDHLTVFSTIVSKPKLSWIETTSNVTLNNRLKPRARSKFYEKTVFTSH